MRKRIAKKMHVKNNAGSTMVEVLVGFTILVAVLAECSVHLLGAAGNMVMKAKDMQTARQELNQELYKKEAMYKEAMYTDIGATVTLTLDTEKTDINNYSGITEITETSKPSLSLPLTATVKKFYSSAAELTIIHIDQKETTTP